MSKISMFLAICCFYSLLVAIANAANESQGQTCGNGMVQPSLGEECDDGNIISKVEKYNFIDGDGCSSNCLIEAGFVCYGHPSVCSICGNGIVQGGETCDDGNTSDNDGCSSQCQIESGYTCSGSPSNCSKCGDSKIGGTEECDDGNLINGDGCSSTCKKETTSSSSNSVCGNGKVENGEDCDDGNIINGDGCSNICKIENYYVCNGNPSVCSLQIEIQTVDKAIGMTFQTSVGFGVSSQTLVSSLIGQSLIGMWVMINCLQLMRYLSLLALYLPKNIFIFLTYINLVNFQNQNLQNLYQYHINSDDLSQRDISNFRYVNQGIQSSSILMNCGDTFIVVIFAIIYYIFLCLVCTISKYFCPQIRVFDSKKKSKRPSRFSKYQSKYVLNKSEDASTMRDNSSLKDEPKKVQEVHQSSIKRNKNKDFMFNTVIRIGLEAFIDLLFAAVLNIKTVTFRNTTDIYSSVVAFTWLILMFSLFLFVVAVPFIVKKDYTEDNVNDSRYGVLLKEFKANSSQAWLINKLCLKRINFCLFENAIFMFRRTVIVVVLLCFENNGILQTSIILAMCFIIIIVKIFLKPYKGFITNLQDIVSEFAVICIVSILLTFYSRSTMFVSSGSANILGIYAIISEPLLILYFLIRSKCKSSKIAKKDEIKAFFINTKIGLQIECPRFSGIGPLTPSITHRVSKRFFYSQFRKTKRNSH